MDQAASRKIKRDLGTEIAKTVVSLLVLGAGVALFFYLYSLGQDPEDKDSDVLIPLVEVHQAEIYDGKIDLVVSGAVEAATEIKLTAEINGTIVEKYPKCEPGTYVTEGTPLLKIDQMDYDLALKVSEADLKQAEKQRDETKVDITGAERTIEHTKEEYRLMEKDHNRNINLMQRGAISKSEFDQSARSFEASKSQLTAQENALSAAKARLERMKAAVEVAQSRVAQAEQSLKKTIIVAPTDGVIVQEQVQKGDYARSGDMLLMFEDTRSVEVLCTLTSTDLAWLRDNKPVDTSKLTPEEKLSAAYQIPKTHVSIFEGASPDDIWSGRLERIDGIGRDVKTKTIPVRIVIDKPIIDTDRGPRALVRNMFVKCRIEVDLSEANLKEKPICFPTTGLRPGNFVWLAKGKTLDRCKVKVLDYVLDETTGEPMVVVRGGKDTVQPSDQIIISPLSQGTVGAEIRLVETDDTEEPVGEENKEDSDKEDSKKSATQFPENDLSPDLQKDSRVSEKSETIADNSESNSESNSNDPTLD